MATHLNLPTGKADTEGGLSPAVRAATHRALAARERLLKEYPQWEAWRDQARALKAQAIAHLDELLASLQGAVESWGGTVLWAHDAAQAKDLILEVARKHRVTSLVKSKSMTTEEIGLNPSLTAAGFQVRETDLGEFIVQLAGQPPAHLTAPAMHLDRHRISALFQEHLGQDPSQDPETLSLQAAAYLRPHYYQAQMGITGVNFAGADGTLVFLENEGNLRLTATLPPVHLALMGLEKVIGGAGEVEVFLRLLPASATGQRLTALVHFLRGLKPRPPGPQAFYLVLLDNGRRRLAADPDLNEALYCLRCGACLNICPVFQLGGAHLYGRVYPGAIGILLAPYLAPVGDISDLCSQCGACEEICPVKIRLPEKIRQVRAQSRKFREFRLLSRIAGLGLSLPPVYRQLEPGLRLLQEMMPHRLQSLLGTPLSPESFHRRWRRGRAFTVPVPSPGGDLAVFRSPDSLPGFTESQAAGVTPMPVSGPAPPPLEERAASFPRVRGPRALARWVADRAGEPLWLEDHPWLSQAAPEMARLGLTPRLTGDAWAPEADTAVTVGLGAVPETGSVLVAASTAAATLPFRARKHLVVIPAEVSDLDYAQALKLLGQRRGLVTWITGPTRTADIEKVLVLGAQGPGEVEAVCYHPEE